MHITHVVRQFAPSLGGLEDVVYRLAAEQVRVGWAVRVVTLDRVFASGERLPARQSLDGIEVVRIPYRGSTRYPVAPSVLFHLGDADIVHVHAIDFFFDWLGWLRPLHRHRLVATTHGGFFHTKAHSRLKRLWFATMTRISSRLYDAVVACSTSDERLFARLNTGRLTLIENGVSIDKFAGAASAAPKKGLVTIGRFSFNKRLDRLLDAFAILLRDDPDWRLTIVGAASDQTAEEVARLAAERGLSSHVDVIADATEAEIAAAIAKASLYVSASEYEGFGLTLVEALSAGLVPVVHDNEAFREFEKKYLGIYLCDFSNPESTVAAIKRAWSDRTRPELDLPAQAMTLASRFDWVAVAQRYQDLYTRVLAHA